ncbi:MULTISPECIES: ABC-three component system middle component 6 [Streptomyces]|uniref:ABC-three component system middle component 6 n=1 Tax=Streptomyces TaxID=1883 RepID=UPI0029A071C8|nr:MULTISPECIES: ABC-three component system middle component 6 [Streptomyces]MDX3087692.1 hypothetical protein [Streptomyces sp. ME12-02E]MDX3331128.1 hypothetical protein [Streptomyces sp. ME02-6978a]
MIAPSKYVTTDKAILGQATIVLKSRQSGATVSELWDKVRKGDPDLSYERFILCLDFLYIVGLVDIEGGTLEWRN